MVEAYIEYIEDMQKQMVEEILTVTIQEQCDEIFLLLLLGVF